MARTAVTATQIDRSGDQVTGAAANVDGHSVTWRDTLFFYVNNGSGSAVTVTVDTPGTVDGLAITDLTLSVPAGEDRIFGPFPADYYRQSDGSVHVDFSAVTSVTFSAWYV